MQEEKNFLFEEEETINIKEIVGKYLYYWKWFVLSIVIAFAIAYVYGRYLPNQYKVATSILIDDGSNGEVTSELSAFTDLGIGGKSKKSIENEMGILKSYSLMERVVKELGLNTTFYKPGRVRDVELYGTEVPFKVVFSSRGNLDDLSTSFTIQPISETQFKLVSEKVKEDASHMYVFGEKVATTYGSIIVLPNGEGNRTKEAVKVNVVPLKAVVEGLRRGLNVALLYEDSSIVALSLVATHPQKTTALLNALVTQYNEDAVADKSLVGKNTSTFIKERLAVIEKDLSNVDKGVENFMSSNRLTDISSEATMVLQSNAELENKIVAINTQLRLTEYVMDYITDNKEHLIPANLGLQDGSVNANSSQYNTLLLERNRILKGSSDINPVIVNLNAQIAQLRRSIAQGLVNLKASLQISLADAKRAENKVSARMTSVPKQEREYKDIQRQQQIIETLYLYLLQKREENAIALAVTAPNAKLIDSARSTPIGSKRKKIYMAAILLGGVIPFVIIYVLFLLNNKVQTSKDVEGVVKAPYLGEIPKTKELKKIVVSKEDRSVIAEAFRMLRTNLSFMISGDPKEGKSIFVTSAISGEGKTFIAVNLASVLALSDKKVLLVGADIRRPRFEEYLGKKLGKGMTHYLTDTSLPISEIIYHLDDLHIDVLPSGVKAPNPSELLGNGRFENILAYGKEHYDYVIVDTAPVKMVSDTMLLGKEADLFIYVVRSNYTDKELLELPTKLYKEKRLPNVSVLLNDVDLKRTRPYGYQYAYEYGEDGEKSWWKKMKKLE